MLRWNVKRTGIVRETSAHQLQTLFSAERSNTWAFVSIFWFSFNQDVPQKSQFLLWILRESGSCIQLVISQPLYNTLQMLLLTISFLTENWDIIYVNHDRHVHTVMRYVISQFLKHHWCTPGPQWLEQIFKLMRRCKECNFSGVLDLTWIW